MLFAKLALSGYPVYKGKLQAYGAVKGIVKIAEGFKGCRLIVRLCKLIVNVEKLNALGVEFPGKPANAVRVHHFIGNCLLGGVLLTVSFCLPYEGGYLFLLCR